MQKPDPWDISPELRQRVVDTVVSLLDSDDPEVALQAAELIIQMDAQNQQHENRGWLGKPSNN